MDNDTTTNQKQARKRLPFCRQEKSSLAMINNAECFAQNCGSTLAVYTALTWIASDHQRDIFSVSHRHIASRSGVSPSTVKRILPNLNRLGLITIEPHFVDGIQTGNTYSIIRGITPVHNEPTHVQVQNGRGPQIKNVQKNLEEVETQLDRETQTHPEDAQHSVRRSAASDLLLEFSDEERVKIGTYHRILADNDPANWAQITKWTTTLSDALALYDEFDFALLCEAAAQLIMKGIDTMTFTIRATGEERTYSIPKPHSRTGKRTLVRLIWENY